MQDPPRRFVESSLRPSAELTFDSLPIQVSVLIASECQHGQAASLLSSGALPLQGARGQLQTVAVRSTAGWSFDLQLKPPSSGGDAGLVDKYSIAEFVQVANNVGPCSGGDKVQVGPCTWGKFRWSGRLGRPCE